jgi:kynurenine formamidase
MKWRLAAGGLLILSLGCAVLAVMRSPVPVRAEDSAPASSGSWDDDARLVDLTHAFNEQTVYWPTEIPFHLERGPFGMTAGGWFYSANRFRTAEHSGTHIDAPIHFAKAGESVDKVPLARLAGPGAVIDVSAECRQNADFLLTTAILQAWEEKHGQQLHDKIVLVHTGWDKYWPDRAKYLGTAETGKGAVAKLHFPGVDPEAAAWLVVNRHIRAIGIDTASIDRGQSKTFSTHVVLCTHNTPAFENVTHLDQLPATGFTVIALPMKIADGSGGPLRIIGVVPK